MEPCTTSAAAKKIGVTRATLQQWIKDGRVRAPRIQVRIGKPPVRLWSTSDIAKLEVVKKQIKTGRPTKKA
jgi:excisionase family DNA binding protein